MKYVMLIFKLVPMLFNIVKELEVLFPESGKGTMKLQLLKQIIEDLYPELMQAWELIEKVVATIVANFNENGVFKKD